MAGRAAARSSALRELIRLVYDQVKFSAKVRAELSSLALVTMRRGPLAAMHAAALGSAPPRRDPWTDAPRPSLSCRYGRGSQGR